ISCATSFGPHVQLHDYTGRHGDIWTDPHGQATFTIPSDAFSNGQSYLCFSRTGLDAPNHVTPRTATQAIFGAPDLDVRPIGNARATVGRITVERNTAITLKIAPDRRGWGADSSVRVTVNDPTGHTLIEQPCTHDATLHAHTATRGEHVVMLTG